MPFQLPNGRLVSADNPFVLDDIQYSPNWLRHASQGEKDALGITWVDPEPETPPPSPPVVIPQVISDRQFFQALVAHELITPEEALAAVGPGTIPQALVALIGGLPQEEQFPAQMLLTGATSFDRQHPMVLVFGAAFGWTPEQIDSFWLEASAL